ncbi:MAG: hypothetical protein II942_01020 [Alphaproteobacteria bacterium]|nr:hypothetical protein [Alphaproteobacteria bacterium]
MRSKHNQQGRTLVEVIGILAILAILTIGGLTLFEMASSGAISKNLMDATVELAISRRNTLLSPMAKLDADKLVRTGPHNTPMSVENGQGSSDDIFWVTLGSQDHLIAQDICNELLKKSEKLRTSKLGFVAMTLDDTPVTQCDHDGEIKFLFSKIAINADASGSWIKPHTPSEEECPSRLCPTGGVCSGGNLSACLPGYHMVSCDTCNVTCQKCPAGTYMPTQTTSCEDCLPCSSEIQHTNTTQTQCIQLKPGDRCPSGGFVNDDLDCVDCLSSDNCDPGEVCDSTTFTCRKDCGDGKVADENGICHECDDDGDCDICYSCDSTTYKCEKDANNHPDNAECHPDSSGFYCNAGYYKHDNVCVACPAPLTSNQGATKEGDCYCPNNYYLTTEGVCTACVSGSTSIGPNATTCTCTDDTKEWNPTTNTCKIQIHCGDNASAIDETCWCNAGYYGDGQICTKCGGYGFTSTPGENTTTESCYCPDGSFIWPDDPIFCALCESVDAIGSVSHKNATACVCPAGHWWDAQSVYCTSCPYNTTSDQGSTKESDCYCPDNYYLRQPNNLNSCDPCDEDSTSQGPNATACVCQTGYYWDDGCLPCPDNSSSDGTSCICQENYYWNQNYCAQCPSKIGPIGAASVDKCCAADQVLDPDSNTCVSCINDNNCAGDMTCNSNHTCECPNTGRWITLTDGTSACVVLETHTLGTGSYTKKVHLTKSLYTFADAQKICNAWGKTLFWSYSLRKVTNAKVDPYQQTIETGTPSETQAKWCVNATWTPSPLTNENGNFACCWYYDEQEKQQKWVEDLDDIIGPSMTFWTGNTKCSGNTGMVAYAHWTQYTNQDPDFVGVYRKFWYFVSMTNVRTGALATVICNDW